MAKYLMHTKFTIELTDLEVELPSIYDDLEPDEIPIKELALAYSRAIQKLGLKGPYAIRDKSIIGVREIK